MCSRNIFDSDLLQGGFTVCFANVVVAGSLNYEENNRHTVIVRATDVSGLHKAVRFTITVVDVNDKPEARKQRPSSFERLFYRFF